MTKNITISHIGSSVMVLIALVIALAKPFSEGMDSTSHIMLGGIIVTLCIWIFKPFNLPYAIGGMFLAFSALSLGILPSVAFAGFSQSAVWTLIPALFFGYALQNTGLGKRIALVIIKMFKPSYASLVFAWVLIGIVLSMLTPSITVRIAIVIPIVLQCCELCGIKKGSKGNSLIVLTAFAMAIVPGTGWFSGSLTGPIFMGMYNAIPELDGIVTFSSWFDVAFIPFMISTVLLAILGFFLLNPKESIPKDVIDVIRSQSSTKISRREGFAAVILSMVFIMFLTSEMHGMPDVAVCLAAVFAFFLFGVLESKDFNIGVNWDLVIFIGSAISLSAIFTETDISSWLSGIVVPALAPIAVSPWLFAYCTLIFMFAWRFFDVAILIPTTAIMVPILPAIYEAYQIHPLVWITLLAMPLNTFFRPFQNMWAVMSVSIAGDRIWVDKHLTMYGTLYFITCLIALAVAVPMWVNAGLFG